MIRGEIWTVAGGVYASKPRSALIVQDDAFAATESTTVLPITTRRVDAALLRIRVDPVEDTGLKEAGDVMVDKLTTVRRSSLGARIGRVPDGQLAEIERALMVFLGLAR